MWCGTSRAQIQRISLVHADTCMGLGLLARSLHAVCTARALNNTDRARLSPILLFINGYIHTCTYISYARAKLRQKGRAHLCCCCGCVRMQALELATPSVLLCTCDGNGVQCFAAGAPYIWVCNRWSYCMVGNRVHFQLLQFLFGLLVTCSKIMFSWPPKIMILFLNLVEIIEKLIFEALRRNFKSFNPVRKPKSK